MEEIDEIRRGWCAFAPEIKKRGNSRGTTWNAGRTLEREKGERTNLYHEDFPTGAMGTRSLHPLLKLYFRSYSTFLSLEKKGKIIAPSSDDTLIGLESSLVTLLSL